MTAAIFGVGAPEAVLVGVVALVVFGPKGLAQVGPFFQYAARRAHGSAGFDADMHSLEQCQIHIRRTLVKP